MDQIEQRIDALRERCDRLVAGAMLAGSTETDLKRAARFVELARDRAAEATLRALTSRIRAADAHERVARVYERAGTDGSIEKYQAQAARHRQLAAADRAAAEAMAASMPGDQAGDHEPPRRADLVS
jgi:hypothetical protein